MCKLPFPDCSSQPRISPDSSVVVTSIWGSQDKTRYVSVPTPLFASLLQSVPLSTRCLGHQTNSAHFGPSPRPTHSDHHHARPTPFPQTPNATCRTDVPDPRLPNRSSNLRHKTSSRNSSTSNSVCANSKFKYRKKGHTRPWRPWLVGPLFRFPSKKIPFFFWPGLVFGFGDFGCVDAVGWSGRKGTGGEAVRVYVGTKLWRSRKAESGGFVRSLGFPSHLYL